MSSQNSSLHELLRQQLLVARQLDQQTKAANQTGVMMEIPATGKLLSSAYEQLRNAAENAEEHLLLQRAIKRFCRRNLFTMNHQKDIGTELIVELAQAGYLRGDGFGKATADKIDVHIRQCMEAFGHLRQAHVDRDAAMDWVLAVISSETENLLNPHYSQQAMVFFAYHHFLQSINKDQFTDLPEIASYEFCMYIAVHQALLKSDRDTVRYELLRLYQQAPSDVAGFKRLNQQIDDLYNSALTQQLKRIIGRYGAPFRILKSLIDDRSDAAELLPHETAFMEAYQRQINQEYGRIQKRLNRGLVKSIIFIFITKVLIGLSIEVPYDLIVTGTIGFLPLAVNLLFPPIYMASLKLSLKLPSDSNAQTVANYMQRVLFSNEQVEIQARPQRIVTTGGKLLYTLLFLIPILITVLILKNLDFNAVQMIIFFAFFSTASFLGFRLSSQVRELEMTVRQNGLFASMRDFFYLPFILTGQWLSRKYSRINAVARFLDVAIELPLKAILRLVRQWIRFLNEKHEELY